MPIEELSKIAISKLIDYGVALVAGYFILIIKHIKKDIEIIRQCQNHISRDIDKLEETTTCLKISIGKLEQNVEDNKRLCDQRHSKT